VGLAFLLFLARVVVFTRVSMPVLWLIASSKDMGNHQNYWIDFSASTARLLSPSGILKTEGKVQTPLTVSQKPNAFKTCRDMGPCLGRRCRGQMKAAGNNAFPVPMYRPAWTLTCMRALLSPLACFVTLVY
jgi:hypothetical protein